MGNNYQCIVCGDVYPESAEDECGPGEMPCSCPPPEPPDPNTRWVGLTRGEWQMVHLALINAEFWQEDILTKINAARDGSIR